MSSFFLQLKANCNFSTGLCLTHKSHPTITTGTAQTKQLYAGWMSVPNPLSHLSLPSIYSYTLFVVCTYTMVVFTLTDTQCSTHNNLTRQLHCVYISIYIWARLFFWEGTDNQVRAWKYAWLTPISLVLARLALTNAYPWCTRWYRLLMVWS